MALSDTCEHGRTEPVCEYCKHAAAVKAGRPVPPVAKLVEKQPANVVDTDRLVDVGDNLQVFIAAGDPVPAELAEKVPASARKR